jgi:hypothetical protein
MGIKDSFLFSSLIHHHALDWCSTDPSFNAVIFPLLRGTHAVERPLGEHAR